MVLFTWIPLIVLLLLMLTSSLLELTLILLLMPSVRFIDWLIWMFSMLILIHRLIGRLYVVLIHTRRLVLFTMGMLELITLFWTWVLRLRCWSLICLCWCGFGIAVRVHERRRGFYLVLLWLFGPCVLGELEILVAWPMSLLTHDFTVVLSIPSRTCILLLSKLSILSMQRPLVL